MKKKLITSIATVISIFLMTCSISMAETESAAVKFAKQLNETKENSCEVNGEVVKLLSDVMLNKSLLAEGTIYFDLNGYSLTGSEGLSAIVVDNGGSFYVENEGNIIGGKNGGSGIRVKKGELTINGGNIKGGPGNVAAHGIYAYDQKVVVNAGTVAGGDGTENDGCGISAYYGTVTVTNGIITGDVSVSGGDITIYDGIFNGTVSVKNSGTIKGGTIKGGDETANYNAKEGVVNAGTLTVEGGTITGGNGTGGSGAAGITSNTGTTIVKGGTIKGGSGYSGGAGIAGKTATVKTEGGTITGGNGTEGTGGDGIDIGKGTAEIKNTKIAGGNGAPGGTGIIGAVTGSSTVFATVKVYNSEISGGSSTNDASGGSKGYGIYTTKGEVEVKESTVKSGKGKGAAAISAVGGKIAISSSEIRGEGGFYGNLAIDASRATLTVTNSDIYGGAITDWSEDSAYYDGADAIRADYGTVTVTESNIYGGDVILQSAKNLDQSKRGGEGIYASYGTITVIDSDIYGGSIESEDALNGFWSGSAVAASDGKITITNSRLYSGSLEAEMAEQCETASAVSASGSTVNVSDSVIHSGNINVGDAKECSTGEGIFSGKMPVTIVNSEICSGDIFAETGYGNISNYGIYANKSTLEIIKGDIRSGSILIDESENDRTYSAVVSGDGILKITDGSDIRSGNIEGNKVYGGSADSAIGVAATVLIEDSEVFGGNVIATEYMEESECGEGISNNANLTITKSNIYGGSLTGTEGEMNNAGCGVYIGSTYTLNITGSNIYGGNVTFETGTDCYSGKGIDGSYVAGTIILENSNVFGGTANVTNSKYCDGGAGISGSKRTVSLKNSTVMGGVGGDSVWSVGGVGIDAKEVILYEAKVSGGDTRKAIPETISVATGFVVYESDDEKTFTRVEGSESDKKYIRSCDINNIPVMGIALDKSEINISDRGVENIVATVSPSDAKNKSIIWTSSDESVATVKDGTVRGRSAGVATITATTEDGKAQASCTVAVYHLIPSLGSGIGKISFTVQTSHPYEGAVYAVLYDSNGTVQDVKKYDSQSYVTINFDEGKNGAYIKVMEWDNLRPLTENKTYYLD